MRSRRRSDVVGSTAFRIVLERWSLVQSEEDSDSARDREAGLHLLSGADSSALRSTCRYARSMSYHFAIRRAKVVLPFASRQSAEQQAAFHVKIRGPWELQIECPIASWQSLPSARDSASASAYALAAKRGGGVLAPRLSVIIRDDDVDYYYDNENDDRALEMPTCSPLLIRALDAVGLGTLRTVTVDADSVDMKDMWPFLLRQRASLRTLRLSLGMDWVEDSLGDAVFPQVSVLEHVNREDAITSEEIPHLLDRYPCLREINRSCVYFTSASAVVSCLPRLSQIGGTWLGHINFDSLVLPLQQLPPFYRPPPLYPGPVTYASIPPVCACPPQEQRRSLHVETTPPTYALW
jgi:hypothetical protein